MKIYIGFLFLVILLIGCSEATEPTYDVKYYKTHEVERLAKLEWCKGNAERKQTFNCRNAGNARAQIRTALLLGEGIPLPK